MSKSIESYSIKEIVAQHESAINGWNRLIDSEMLAMSMAFEHWYKRLSAFHSRIVKVRMTNIESQLKQEILDRLNKKIELVEEKILITKKKINQLIIMAEKSMNDLTGFYSSAIDNKKSHVAYTECLEPMVV